MTRTRAWLTAAIVAVSFVGLAVLIGASTGNLGFHGNTADANLGAPADAAPRDVQPNAVTTSYWEDDDDEDEDEDGERDHEDEDSHREHDDDHEEEGGEDD